ncbi:hypothetical protein E3P96_03137 [Wallemia ichthyophaga]|nr:hypothetical protein E3P96_03137 [Wallemia ichthyophaga]
MKGNVAGVVAAIAGNVVIALGLNIQKLSHLQISNLEENDDTLQYLRNGTFWVGLAMSSLGECCNFIAYGLSPAPLVAPLGSCALVANGIFSPILLQESFGLQEIAGSMLCITGAFILVSSNTAREDNVDYNTLITAINRPSFQTYLFCLFTAIFLLMALSNSTFARRSVTVDILICALFGSLTVISTKALSGLLVKDVAGAFTHQITYVALIVLLLTAAAQVHFLNKALNRFHSKIVIPTQYIYFTISVIFSSSVLFNDLDSFPYPTLLLGLVVSFCGVFFLCRAPESEQQELERGCVRRCSIESAQVQVHSRDLSHPAHTTRIKPIRARSNSSLTKVGIGLSPAQYLLASHAGYSDEQQPLLHEDESRILSQTYNSTANHGDQVQDRDDR